MKFLTWNIGSYLFQKYLRSLYQKDAERYEYFRPELNATFVSETISAIAPTVAFLQEFYLEDDRQSIPSLAQFTYHYPLNMWYRANGAFLASNTQFEVTSFPQGGIFRTESLTIVAVHLNSYSAKQRQTEITEILEHTRTDKNIILLGDTNMWIRKTLNLFPHDRYTHALLKKRLVDHSMKSGPTTPLGFSLDRVFTTPTVAVTNLTTHPETGTYMDHYPVHFEIKKPQSNAF